jgi:hypothetical protein
MYVQQASTAAALITSPCVLAFAFFTLTCNLFLAFINICQNNTLASHPKRNINGLQKKGTPIIYEIWPDQTAPSELQIHIHTLKQKLCGRGKDFMSLMKSRHGLSPSHLWIPSPLNPAGHLHPSSCEIHQKYNFKY